MSPLPPDSIRAAKCAQAWEIIERSLECDPARRERFYSLCTPVLPSSLTSSGVVAAPGEAQSSGDAA